MKSKILDGTKYVKYCVGTCVKGIHYNSVFAGFCPWVNIYAAQVHVPGYMRASWTNMQIPVLGLCRYRYYLIVVDGVTLTCATRSVSSLG